MSRSVEQMFLRCRLSALRRAALVVCVHLCLLACAAWAQKAVYTNPVVAGDYPDPTVVRVSDEYWMMTTSGTWAPHFPILRSRDLVNWQLAGYVFAQRPAWAKSDFWAPELVEDGGRFRVYYTARRDDGAGKKGTLCVAVASASSPAGPYTDHGTLVCQDIGSIDAFFIRDEEGKPFLIWKEDGNDRNQPTPIWAQPLTPDGLKLTGKRKEILRNTEAWERHVTEGSYILRHGRWFYHFYSGNACCGRGCNYALGVARSLTLLGKWEKNPANPILKANHDWQCPGHGSIVETPDRRYFLLYHSYRQRRDTFNIGRESLLDEVRWDEASGWPSINAGRGPSSLGESPLGVAETEDDVEFFDDFNAPQLKLEWQWPMFNQQQANVDTGAGQLILTPLADGSSSPKDELTGAVVARRTTSGDFTATTRVDGRSLRAGARAGLSLYSWRWGAAGISFGDGRVFTWRREGKDQKTLAQSDALRSTTVYLRATARGGDTYRFAFSTDGKQWTELGGIVEGGFIEGARVALVAGGAPARFDWIRITPQTIKN